MYSKSVEEYLKYNMDLERIIVKAKNKLSQLFEGYSFDFELSFDPPTCCHAPGRLILSILQNASSDKAMELLCKFDDEWWIHQPEFSSSRLIITIESKK